MLNYVGLKLEKHWCGDAQQQQFQKMLLSSAFVIKCEKGVQRISQLFKLSACRNGACVLKKSDAGEDYGKQLQRVIPTKTRKKSVWKAFQAERFSECFAASGCLVLACMQVHAGARRKMSGFYMR